MAEVSDADLDVEHPLPWNADAKMTTADMMFFPYWNLVYHVGQINYIQLLLGDTEMHM
jgi:hypothetical protein